MGFSVTRELTHCHGAINCNGYPREAKSLLNPFCVVIPAKVASDFSIDDLVKELDKEKAKVTISKDIRRFSKPVTLISGLAERSDIKEITKQLKTRIGTGGTFKDGHIILQGDHREAAKALLISKGFSEDSIEVM